jgi:HEPN domain-containing protein
MKPETGEWIAKAEGDFRSMEREALVCDFPNYDLICFLSQQCTEKYLKAVLIEHLISFPKIHDLAKIAALLPSTVVLSNELKEQLPLLTLGAVEFRYAGDSATSEQAKSFASVCRVLRLLIRQQLGLTAD